MEENKIPNPFMQEFDGIHASDAYKSQSNAPELSFTLRDHFAGLAMKAILTNHELLTNTLQIQGGELTESVSINAYAMADEMLKQRIK